MMKRCDTYQQYLKDRLAGELSEALTQELEGHLKKCAACRKEEESLQAILGIVRQFEDEPVPHHFFVYEESRDWFSWLQRLLGGWKWASAAAMVVILLGLTVIVINTRVEIGSRSVTLTFGTPISSQQTSDEASRALVERLQEVSQQQNAQWRDEFKRDMLQLFESHDQANRGYVDAGLEELSRDFSRQIDGQDAAIREDLTVAMQSLGRSLLAAHEQDMEAVRWSLSRSAQFDQLQVDQTDLIMTTLAELSVSQ